MVVDLEIEVSYATVPVLSPHVYMKAVAKNVSEYQLLPGNMNVFLNNFFVTSSSLAVRLVFEQSSLFR